MAIEAPHPVIIEALELVQELADTRRAAQLEQNAMLRDEHLADHARASARLQDLWAEHDELLSAARLEYTASLRHAITLHQRDLTRRQLEDKLAAFTERAASVGRELTGAERQRLDALQTSAVNDTHSSLEIAPPASPSTALRLLSQIRVREARAQLDSGLLLTDQMRHIIAEALPALRRGDPQLFIGETGGAKTALAEYVSGRITEQAPEFISGYGDITSAQVIGAHELRAVNGATFTEFVAGPLLRAMTEGLPIILDELNAMPPEFLKRLNRILQLRPGDIMSVQEHAGARVRIAEGFVVLATANEQMGRRYRGIEPLSAELLNRFGAGTFRVRYPDAHVSFTDVPSENLLLVSAAASLQDGRIPRHLGAEDLLRLARAAFISQHVFAGSRDEGFAEYLSTEHSIDGRPGLEESVLAPRTVVSLVQKVARSAGAVSLDQAVARFVDGVMHHEDRRVLTLILRGQGFAV